MNNVTIKRKLLLLVLVPSIAFLALSIKTLYISKSKFDNTSNIVSLMQLTSDASQLVFNLQRERGLSAGYLKAKKEEDKLLILQQIKKTNKSIKIFKMNIKIDRRLLNELKQLEIIRDEIVKCKIDDKKAFTFYTNFISNLLSVENKIILLSQDKTMLQMTQVNMKLLLAIEYAGQERAVINSIFSGKKLSVKQFQKFSALNLRQSEYLENYKKFTSKTDNDIFSNPKEYSYFTNSIIKNLGKKTINENSCRWWKVSTVRINELIKLCLHDQNILTEHILKKRNQLYNTFLFTLFSIIIILIILIIWFNSIMKNFISSLNYLSKGIEDFILFIIYRDRKIDEIVINSNDEIGLISKSINKHIKMLEVCFRCDERVINEVSKSVINAKKDIYLVNEIKCFADNTQLENMKFDFNEMIEIIKERTDDLNIAKAQVEIVHKHTRDSIEYASLIQGAVVAQSQDIMPYFKDSFVYWIPKDTVGGDIWLFEQLRHEDECLLFFIDCTGHGVPGAFVTMIVKSIEREIVAKLKKRNDLDISPAIIMGYFNKTMKTLLRQEDASSLSNAGWDGGIIYYNKRTQILKFAGAETPLFYTMPDGEFKTVKGNRYSVGYKKCDMDYKYKETIINVQEGMKFYCTTDGYLDQNGGEKGFPFGKKRFSNIIKENYKESMAELQTIFQMEMLEWEELIPNNDRNDDITLIGFEIDQPSNYVENIVKEIVRYEGIMTQNVIASAMDNIEAKVENIGLLGIISTITIEYCQNMMNYSKGIRETDNDKTIVPAGTIIVKYINYSYYEIVAINIISQEDKEKIEPKLIEIQSLDKKDIKKRYRELRKSGQNTHSKGGGIGMYEIAKVSDKIEYNFKSINNDKYYFTMKSIVK